MGEHSPQVLLDAPRLRQRQLASAHDHRLREGVHSRQLVGLLEQLEVQVVSKIALWVPSISIAQATPLWRR
jgi:hypothetical protein